jgi:hypothetical protein
MGIDPSTMVSLVDQLETAGLAKRRSTRNSGSVQALRQCGHAFVEVRGTRVSTCEVSRRSSRRDDSTAWVAAARTKGET